MTGWLARLFPAKTLAGVREPVPVRILARVHSPNTLVSPLSGHTGALIVWRFLTHYTDHSGQTPVDRHKLLWACSRGGDLVLVIPEGTVLVPAKGRVIAAGGDGARGAPQRAPAAGGGAARAGVGAGAGVLRRAAAAQRGPGAAAGDGGAVRGAEGVGVPVGWRGRTDFEARPDLGKVVVEDLLFA